MARKYNLKQPSNKPLVRTYIQKSFFFLNGKLYRTIKQFKSADLLYAQDQVTQKLDTFVLSEVKKKMKPAFDTLEVANLVNRDRSVVQSYVYTGKIRGPVRIYSYGMNYNGRPFDRMKWSVENILELHEYLLTNPNGRPRKDGILTPGSRLPSRVELLARIRNQPMFYMQTSDGDMVPVWSAHHEI